MCVRHGDATVSQNRDPTRFSVNAFRRFPELLQLSKSIEDLDSAGHVDDVQLVRIINGDGSRLDEATIIEPLSAPNFSD